MSFLAPALLAGLAAIAIPILLHLVQRERRRVVEFPSLMFLRKIPYQSVRRRAIRHWPLLLLRVVVIALLAVAFARPFLRDAGADAAAGGAGRDLVVLVDRSASMGYGDHWTRARDAARAAVQALGPDDRGTVAFFAADVEMGPRQTTETGALVAAIDGASPGSGATRYAPALRAAAGLLETSTLAGREIVLISDFQKSGWDASDDPALPAGVVVTPVHVTTASPSNAALAGLTIERERPGGREQLLVAARVVNRGVEAISNRDVALDVDGRQVDSRRVSIEPGAAAAATFTPFAVPPGGARVTVRLAADALVADNVFHAVVPAAERIPVLIVESSNPEPDASLYVTRALDVGRVPGFRVTTARADRVTGSDMRQAAIVVLNDAALPSPAARALETSVRGGAGLFVVLGERSAWPADAPDLLPGIVGPPVDRSGTRGGTLGYLDLGHPALEIFRTPRSGDLTAARVFRYRQVNVPAGRGRQGTTEPPGAPGPGDAGRPADTAILARFDDGAVALAERRVGQGRVVIWTSTLDSYWNDFALKPVFVPFLHEVMKHLAGFVEPKPWYLAGQVFEIARNRVPGVESAAAQNSSFVVLAPGGHQETIGPGDQPLALPVAEQGFYEIRAAGQAGSGNPAVATPMFVAVNVDPAESDLAAIDPAELTGAVVAGSNSPAATTAREITAEERERRQALWWYVLGGILLLLVAELLVANRLPRTA